MLVSAINLFTHAPTTIATTYITPDPSTTTATSLGSILQPLYPLIQPIQQWFLHNIDTTNKNTLALLAACEVAFLPWLVFLPLVLIGVNFAKLSQRNAAWGYWVTRITTLLVLFSVGTFLTESIMHLLPTLFAGEGMHSHIHHSHEAHDHHDHHHHNDHHHHDEDAASLGHDHHHHDFPQGMYIIYGIVLFYAMERLLHFLSHDFQYENVYNYFYGQNSHHNHNDHAHGTVIEHNTHDDHAHAPGDKKQGGNIAESGASQRVEKIKKSTPKSASPPLQTITTQPTTPTNTPHYHIALITLIADTIHNISDGMTLATSFVINQQVGHKTTILILIHEFIRIFADVSILQQSGLSLITAYFLQLITSMGTLLGCVSVLYTIKLLDVSGAAEGGAKSGVDSLCLFNAGLFGCLLYISFNLLQSTSPSMSHDHGHGHGHGGHGHADHNHNHHDKCDATAKRQSLSLKQYLYFLFANVVHLSCDLGCLLLGVFISEIVEQIHG